MEMVKVKSSHPSCRPGDMTCSFGTIKFDENGEAEITKEQADTIRNVPNLTFSDVKQEDIVPVVAKPIMESKVLETSSMPTGLVPERIEPAVVESEKIEPAVESEKIEPAVEGEKIESKEEISEDNVEASKEIEASVEAESDSELSKLNKEDLKDICKAAELSPSKFNSLNKKDLIELIQAEKLV